MGLALLRFAGLMALIACQQPQGTPRDTTTTVSAGAIAAPAPAEAAVLRDAVDALQQKRPWAATRMLMPLAKQPNASPRVVLVAATAASQWGGWATVETLLRNATWVDAGGGEGRELLARASLGLNHDSLAVSDARAAVRSAPTDSARAVRWVLLARAFDRVDALDSARLAYMRAATMLPSAKDWLLLRAAGVTADSAVRADQYAQVSLPLARERVTITDAYARERTGDLAGAARAYAAAGARVASLRAALAATPANAAAIHDSLVQVLATTSDRDAMRAATQLLDQRFAPLSAQDELTIARGASNAGPASRAVQGFSRAFAANLGTWDDHRRYAAALFATGQYDDAARAWTLARGSAPSGDDAANAAYQSARSLLRAGASNTRKALVNVTTAYPKSPGAVLAFYLLGDLATDDGHDADARRWFLKASQAPAGRPRGASDGLGASAAFHAALIAYVAGSYRTAAQELDHLRSSYPSSDEVLAAAYWSGRAWQRAGNTAAARTRWSQIVQSQPMSYYAALAAKRLGIAVPAPAAVADSFPADASVNAALARARLLESLGLDTEADMEYDRLERDAMQSTDRALATAAAFRASGEPQRGVHIAQRLASRNAVPNDARLYRLLYPRPYADALSAEAREHHLDESLVAALTRQESNFSAGAVSPAGARGLMQLMPDVASGVARALGYPVWDSALLFQPDANLEIGTTHLAEMVKQYGTTERVLAAYNAGGSRVDKWRRKAGTDDPEMFVERIPFDETRDYVRLIERSRALYAALY